VKTNLKYSTGLDLREGCQFAAVFILFLASLWALAVMGGANG